MITHLYTDSQKFADLMWEIEMVAERYFEGGLILIRTKDGWRAHLGNIETELLHDIEKSLDRNVPRAEMRFCEISRKSNLIEEFHQLLPDCMFIFPDYRPMKFVDEFRDNVVDSNSDKAQ